LRLSAACAFPYFITRSSAFACPALSSGTKGKSAIAVMALCRSEELDFACSIRFALNVPLGFGARVFNRCALHHQLKDLPLFLGAIQASKRVEEPLPTFTFARLPTIAYEHRYRCEAVSNMPQTLRELVVE